MKTTIKDKVPARRRSGRPPKKSLFPKLSAHNISKSSTLPISHALPESELDIWFQSGPFSALPQGATPAEIIADLEHVRAAIHDLANILLASAVGAVSSPILSAPSGSSTFSKSISGDTTVSTELPSLSLPASSTSSRRSSRVKMQISIAEPIGFTEPLTPESFYGEDTGFKDAMYDRENVFMDTIAPFTYSCLGATGAGRLSGSKKRDGGSNRAGKKTSTEYLALKCQNTRSKGR